VNPKRFRICHLAVGDAWGGAEAYLSELMRWLVREPDFELSAIVLNEGRLAEELRKLSVKVLIVSEASSNLLNAMTQIVRSFRENPCDLIHTHKPKDNVLGVLAGILSCHPLVVRTVHGSPEIFTGMKRLRMILHELPNQFCNKFLVDRVIAVSNDLKNRLGQYYDSDKVVCIHNGISHREMYAGEGSNEIRSMLGLDKGDYVIGSVGRLTAVKGHEFLIRAAAHFVEGPRIVKVILVGDGPLRKHLEELAFHLGVSERVIFTGHQEHPRGFLRAMDVFVLPSLNEGIPLALLEAMSVSLPIVASRVGGVPEVIEHERAGLLVEPGNEQELAKACNRFIRDKLLADTLGSAAHLKVTSHFSSEVMAAKVVSLYRHLIRHRKFQC
jgi:glycosyltransferase involved in cell wall biosynthesis